MAITKLNSLAIPDDTIVEADLSYPLTNFSSTGIDDNASSTAVTIDSSQNVTVGGTTAGNAGSINVSVGSPGLTAGGVQLWSGTSSSHFLQFGDTASGNGYYRGAIGYLHADDALVAYSAGTERTRIDASGRLLIGKDAVNNSTAGYMFEAGSTGYAAFTNTGTASSHRVILCNRQSGDGSLIDLQRAGSLKGTIGINSGDEPYFARSVGTTSGIKIANGALTACQSDGTNHDNGQDLGSSNIRWRNFHMAGDAVMGSSGNIIYQSGTTFNIRSVAGDLTLQTNGANERIRILSSGGLTFNGDTATANALDDYEEGVHTASASASSGTPSIASTENKISYTAVGNSVFISGQLGTISCSGCSGALYVTMPFVTKTNTDRSDFYFLLCASTVSTIDYFYLSQTGGGSANFLVVAKKSNGSVDSNVATLLASHGVFDLNIIGGTYKKS